MCGASVELDGSYEQMVQESALASACTLLWVVCGLFERGRERERCRQGMADAKPIYPPCTSRPLASRPGLVPSLLSGTGAPVSIADFVWSAAIPDLSPKSHLDPSRLPGGVMSSCMLPLPPSPLLARPPDFWTQTVDERKKRNFLWEQCDNPCVSAHPSPRGHAEAGGEANIQFLWPKSTFFLSSSAAGQQAENGWWASGFGPMGRRIDLVPATRL